MTGNKLMVRAFLWENIRNFRNSPWDQSDTIFLIQLDDLMVNATHQWQQKRADHATVRVHKLSQASTFYV